MSSLLPCILCLHGGGSSGSIFQVQIHRLAAQLSPHFRFIFVNAPYECPAGPGILPTFESMKPYHRWYLGQWSRITATERHLMPTAEVEAVDSVILRAMEETDGGVGSFVGVLGFSQGARLATGLLLRQQRRKMLRARSSNGTAATAPAPLKGCNLNFGVLIAGPYPPITMTDAFDGEEAVGDYTPLETVPMVHTWGKDDQFIDRIRRMAECCEGPNSFIFEYPGGHHMPSRHEPEATATLAEYILKASYAKDAFGSNSNGQSSQDGEIA